MHAGHGLIDGHHADQVKVVHADQVQQEVPADVLLHDDVAVSFHKHHAGMVHLIVCNKSESWRRGLGVGVCEMTTQCKNIFSNSFRNSKRNSLCASQRTQ